MGQALRFNFRAFVRRLFGLDSRKTADDNAEETPVTLLRKWV
jgi:hypothetical protein